jgi:hypothetical protein
VKKLDSNYFPPNTTANEQALCSWIDHISKDRPELLKWAKKLVNNANVVLDLDELSDIFPLPEMLAYLEDLRSDYQEKTEAQKRLEALGVRVKRARKAAIEALTAPGQIADDFSAAVAKDLGAVARLRDGIETGVGRRNADIAEYKHVIAQLLRSRKVIKTDEYGWRLLRAVIPEWHGGKGKDQVEAFRKITYGPIRSRKDALAAVRRAQVGVFRMKKEDTPPGGR